MSRKRFQLTGSAALACLILAACASGPKEAASTPEAVPPPPPPSVVPPPPEPPSRTRSLDGGDMAEMSDFESLPDTAAGAPAASAKRSGKPAKDQLPFIDVAIEAETLRETYGDRLHDRYTRLRIESLDPGAYETERVRTGKGRSDLALRNYRDESRSWLSRMTSSRNVSRTLIAEFNISQPSIKATNALFAASFSSDNKKGEVWTTNESIAVYPTPWFKIGPSTTIEASIRMQLSDERDTSASANVMGALTTAANLIAPTSALVTYFNAPLMAEASNFLNNSAKTLFGNSITEQSTSAFSVQTWTDKPIVVFSAEIPEVQDIKNSKNKGGVGIWAIYLDKPVLSIFTTRVSDESDDLPDFSGVTAGDILAYEVGEDLTVFDYIFSRLELADVISRFNQSRSADDASLICSRISRGLSEIGFTSVDAAAGIWAASGSDHFNPAARRVLQSPGVCDGMDLWLQVKAAGLN